MAEALAYGEKKFKSADAMITVATLGDLTDFGPDLLKVWVTNERLERRVKLAERLSSEKMMLFPPFDHFNHVDEMHIGRYTDLIADVVDGDTRQCYHTAPAVFMNNFFEYEQNWVFIDNSALFDEDWGPEYGAGPGFGLKFLWYLLQQYA